MNINSSESNLNLFNNSILENESNNSFVGQEFENHQILEPEYNEKVKKYIKKYYK